MPTQMTKTTKMINNTIRIRGEILFIIFIALVGVMSFLRVSAQENEFAKENLNDINLINAPEIIAKNAVVFDSYDKKFLYAKNAEEITSLASLAKIITADVFINLNELRRERGHEIKEISIIKRNAGYNQGDKNLINGEKWRPENLIRYTLITSSNLATESIVKSVVDDEIVFTLLMKKHTKDMGFKNFTFNNSSGLPIIVKNKKTEKRIPGALGTAKEISLLFDQIFRNNKFIADASIIQKAKFINLSGNKHQVENVNFALSQIPNVIAGKTGTTDEAGGNVAIILEIKDKRYVIVVLGSTIEARYDDLAKLASTTEAFATSK